MRAPMNTIVLTLLGIVIVATLTFLFLLFRLSLDDADFWLKVISGVLAAFTFLAGAAALVTGTISGNRQAERILMLEKGNLELARTLESERTTRLELEQSVAPRTIKQVPDNIKQFAGTPVFIVNLDDFDARRLAYQLEEILKAAGWKVTRYHTLPAETSGWFDGICVEINADAGSRPEDRSRVAADALVGLFNVNNIEAELCLPLEGMYFPKFNENTMRISIGLRPMAYFREKSSERK